MEIPFGHRAKILKKIKEFKTHRGKFSSFNNSNEKIESDIQTNFEIDKIKHEIGCGVDSNIKYNNNNNDNDNIKKEIEIYDEDEQSRLFKKAVEEFRNGKSLEKKEDKNNNNINKNKKITIIREVDEEVNEVIIFLI
jgi:hypothetical protein